MSQLSSPKRKRDFEFFHIGFKCSRDCSTLVNLFSLGAVEVSFQRFSGVCSLHQGLIGGEVTGVEVSAKGVIGGGVGDSNPRPTLASQFPGEIQIPTEERTHKPT